MNTLTHFGILGMKWGIRRRGPASREHTESREIRKKHVSELSNDEIRKVVTRLQLEKQYKDISDATAIRGRTFLKGILGRVASQAFNVYVQRQAGVDYAGYQAFTNAVRGKTKKG